MGKRDETKLWQVGCHRLKRTVWAVLCLFLIAASGIAGSFVPSATAPTCAANPIPTYVDITLEPAAGASSEARALVYEISGNYVKIGLAQALVYRIDLTKPETPSICYETADAEGWVGFPYDSNYAGCTDYWLIFCPQAAAAQGTPEGRAARQTCLGSALGASFQGMISSPISACRSGAALPKDYPSHLAAHNELYLCNSPTKSYAGLCWPLMLIF